MRRSTNLLWQPTRSLYKCALDRSFLRVKGENSVQYLSSIVTTNISDLGTKDSSQFSLFLSPTGRYILDCFVYKNILDQDDPTSLLIDVAKEDVEICKKYLEFFLLSYKAEISLIDEGTLQCYQWIPEESNTLKKELHGSSIIVNDPRKVEMGWRSICKPTDLQLVEEIVLQNCDEPIKQLDNIYNQNRYLWGIPEGNPEMQRNKAIPLEASLQYFNAINFRKGCYVGQELVTRVHFRGEVRKYIVGVYPTKDKVTDWIHPANVKPSIGDANGSLLSEGIIRNKKGKNIGKMLASTGNIGLAMIRKEAMDPLEKGEESIFTIDGSDQYVCPIKPHWWDQINKQ